MRKHTLDIYMVTAPLNSGSLDVDNEPYFSLHSHGKGIKEYLAHTGEWL